MNPDVVAFLRNEVFYEPGTRQAYAAYLYQSADWWRTAMKRVVPCARDMAITQQETAAVVSRQDRRARGVE